MKPSSIRKVFGIISYFPNNDNDYHIEMRRERSRRFRELLFKLEELWSGIDILIIAQNWQDFKLPDIRNRCITYNYSERLGILGARKELRKKFLESDYDYMIMLDDDAIIKTDNPQAYIDEIDKHPDGVGVIRRTMAPLNLLAISKSIYSQIDMPDIDPEKSQGFEDDIFVAQCFARFPDKAFDFPGGLVTETALKYLGPGKCPSTWADERRYDWDYMRSFTKKEIQRLKMESRQKFTSDENVIPSIDLVLSYVNCSDATWLRSFVRTTQIHCPSTVRFRSWGTLMYLLRGIEKYMPFVRNVVLVVSGPTQIPIWLNKKNVRIVYHEEFIPKQFLPTFNSCTIESYLWNIKGLSDRILYFNDDIFPLAPMKESDFFTGSTPHMKFLGPESYTRRSIFKTQCRSGIDLLTKAMNLPTLEEGQIIHPEHIATAWTRESMEKVGELCKDKIPATISMLRMHKNVNQYIYPYYHYFKKDFINNTVEYIYYDLSDKNIPDVVDIISKEYYQMICLNDSDKVENYRKAQRTICDCFEEKLPNKSKYEL